MKTARQYHWWITGALFVVAVALYATGFGIGAAMTVFLGFVVESIAWISIALHPSENSSVSPKGPASNAASEKSAS
jgi:hypothetical protein